MMRDTTVLTGLVVTFLASVSVGHAGTIVVWERSALGSGLDGHYIDDPVNNRDLGGTYLRLGRSGSGSATYRGTSYGYKYLQVEPERRYRIQITSRRNQWGGVDAGLGFSSAYDGSTKLAQTEGRNALTWSTRSADFTTGSSTSQIQFRFNSFLDFNSSSVSRWHELKDGRLYEIINAPNLAIQEGGLRVNTDSPGGDHTSVDLTLQNVNSWLDRPQTWSMDWGDGVVEPGLPLNQTHAHAYTLAGGDSQTWTATFAGSNLAGSDSDAALVEVLRQPDIALTINGASVLDGETIELDIFNEAVLDLSLVDSLGFIEEASFLITGRLDQIGADLTFSGALFDENDLGLTFPLTGLISNTGLGVNADSISLNLAIVPEPASGILCLAGLAALAAKRRCRYASGFEQRGICG